MDTTLSLLFSALLNCIIAEPVEANGRLVHPTTWLKPSVAKCFAADISKTVTTKVSISECVNAGTCHSANTSVIGACVSSYSVNVSTVYIDSGTAPLHEESICICDITPHTGSDRLFIYITRTSDSDNQTVEILGSLLNGMIVSTEVAITGKTSIVIKTNGVGGVCVNISTVSSNYIDVACYSSGSTTTATKHSTTTITTTTTTTLPTAHVKIATSTEPVTPSSSITRDNQEEGPSSLSISTTVVPLPSKTDKEDESSFIGPVTGAVSGGVVLIVAVIIIVLCKRKRILNKNKSQDNNTLPTISPQNLAEDPYFDMTENPMYDRTDLHSDNILETKRTNTRYHNIEANNGRIAAEGKTEISYVNSNMNNIFHSANTEDLTRNMNISDQSDTDFPQYAIVQRRNKP